MLKKLISHSFIYGLAPQIIKVANFFALPVISKNLTEVDFGVSGVLTAYTASVSVLATLGLRTVLVNSFFKSPSQFKWLWRQLYGFLTMWTWLYAFLVSILIYFIIPKEAIDNRWLILFLNVVPSVFFGPTQTIATTYYQVKQLPFQIAIRSAFFGLATILLNIYFISILKMGYMGWFWSNFIVALATSASYWYPLNFKIKLTPIFNFKRLTIRKSLKVGLPSVPHFYSSYLLNTSDRVVMDTLNVQTADIGKYNVAYTVSGIMSSIGNACGLALNPMLNKLYREGDEKQGKNLIIILQLTFFQISFVLAIWMKEIFRFLIKNEALAKVYPLAIIIVMAYNYRPMYIGNINKLIFHEKTTILWKITLVAGLINVALNFSLIPFFGYQIAAYTTFASLMYMGYAGFYYKSFKEISNVNYYPMAWLLATLLLTVIASVAVEFPFFVKLTGSIVVISLGLFSIIRINKLINGFQSKK